MVRFSCSIHPRGPSQSLGSVCRRNLELFRLDDGNEDVEQCLRAPGDVGDREGRERFATGLADIKDPNHFETGEHSSAFVVVVFDSARERCEDRDAPRAFVDVAPECLPGLVAATREASGRCIRMRSWLLIEYSVKRLEIESQRRQPSLVRSASVWLWSCSSSSACRPSNGAIAAFAPAMAVSLHRVCDDAMLALIERSSSATGWERGLSLGRPVARPLGA